MERDMLRRGARRPGAAFLVVVCRASVAASVTSEPGAAEVRTVDLPALEALALAREPGLVESDHRARALAADARAQGSLPAPTAGVDLWQVPLSKPYAVGDAGMLMLSARQEIPAPGSLSESAQAGSAEARAQGSLRTALERRVVREVDSAFADYVEAVSRSEIRREYAAVAADIAASARRRYAGGGSLAEVARADLERARIEADLAADLGEARAAEAALDVFIGRAADAPLGLPRVTAAQTVTIALSDLETRARAANPEAAAADASGHAASLRAGAERTRARVPSFSVGLSYFHPVGGMPAGWGASAAMSLPWLWGEAAHRAESAQENALGDRAAADSVRLRVRGEVARAFSAVKAAEHRLTRIVSSVAPAARQAIAVSRAAYGAPGGPPLVTVLDAERAALEVELDATAARGSLDRALSDLDAAVGGPVPRVPVSTTGVDASGGTR